MSMSPDRVVLLSTPTDRANLSTIAIALAQAGRAFPTRSEVLRHALSTMAASMNNAGNVVSGDF